MPHLSANSFLSLPLPPDRSLATVLQQVQQSLLEACSDQTSPLRYVILASRDLNGEADARTLVLRDLRAQEGKLRFFSDARAPKVIQLKAHARCSLVFLSPAEGLQYRFSGQAEIQQGSEELGQIWQNLPTSGRFNYLTRQAPGDRLDATTEAAPQNQDLNEESGLDSPDHFAAIDVRIDNLDWLQLGRSQHGRAQFSWQGNSNCTASWVTP